MGSVTLTDSSKVTLKDGSTLRIREDSALTIKGIDKVKNIDPVAVHLKEVNHIDPLSIESLHVSEVKNIEPIEISKFNITNLPMVNVSLQKLPPIDFNVKTIPPVSVGTYQNFCILSNYILRARLLGIELVRLNLDGQTSIIPKDRARREQSRSDNRSFPVTSAAGNPAIPSNCESGNSESCHPRSAPTYYHQTKPYLHQAPQAGAITAAGTVAQYAAAKNDPASAVPVNRNSNALSFGTPRTAFQIPEPAAEQTLSEHRVMTG